MVFSVAQFLRMTEKKGHTSRNRWSESKQWMKANTQTGPETHTHTHTYAALAHRFLDTFKELFWGGFFCLFCVRNDGLLCAQCDCKGCRLLFAATGLCFVSVSRVFA